MSLLIRTCSLVMNFRASVANKTVLSPIGFSYLINITRMLSGNQLCQKVLWPITSPHRAHTALCIAVVWLYVITCSINHQQTLMTCLLYDIIILGHKIYFKTSKNNDSNER